MKIMFVLFIAIVLSFISSNGKYKPTVKKFQIDFCELQGFTCIDCASISKKGENEDDEPYAKLDNGMTFRIDSGDENSFNEGDDVAVFAMKFPYQGKEITGYKLVIEDEIIDVTRTR